MFSVFKVHLTNKNLQKPSKTTAHASKLAMDLVFMVLVGLADFYPV